MISSVRWPKIRTAPEFQVSTMPCGPSIATARSRIPSSRSRRRSSPTVQDAEAPGRRVGIVIGLPVRPLCVRCVADHSHATPSNLVITLGLNNPPRHPAFSLRAGNVNGVMRTVPRLTRGPRALLAAAVALLGVVLAVGLTASPAAALAVDSATPAPGSQSSTAPAEGKLQLHDLGCVTPFPNPAN